MKQSTALNILKSGQNVFITGSAGTGKTYLLNQFIDYLKHRKIYPSIVASTGIAASHLGGQTLHAFFGLGIRDSVDEYFIDSLLEKKYLVERFSQLDILIIDEVSMISPEIFSSMDEILQAFKSNTLAFGGIQVVISGDFFQLPPVSRERKEKRFAWQSPSWKDLELKTCYLSEKYRQDDDVLIRILDEIRSGQVSDFSHDIFKQRFEKDLALDCTPTKLYTHNVDIDRINNQELEKLPGDAVHLVYDSKGSQQNIEKIFKSSLVSDTLVLKKDAVVIFIKNNPEKGYLNGTTGVVTGFTKGESMPQVKISSGRTITLEQEDWSLEGKNGKVTASVSQVPLRLAWAITIHKSQGMTLDAAEIDLSKAFEVGQGYVALSRLKNIEGLKLLGINEIALQVDPLILKIDDRIQSASTKASDEILAVSEEVLEKTFVSYIKSLDGLTDEAKISDHAQKVKSGVATSRTVPNHEVTKALIESSQTIKELSEKRGVTESTVLKHLALLLESDKELNLDKFKPDGETHERIVDIARKLTQANDSEHFSEAGSLKMKPVFEALNEEVSYDLIKVSLLFI